VGFKVNGSVSLYQNLIYNNVSGVSGGGVYLGMGSEDKPGAGECPQFAIK